MDGKTSGSNALSGNLLPHGAVGLIIRLTRDDTRIFASAVGTANINLPIDTISTLRFGVLGRGGYPNRPLYTLVNLPCQLAEDAGLLPN
jgi:hypothetical protein